MRKILSIFLISILTFLLTACHQYRTADIGNYRDFTSHGEYGIYGKLDIFPEVLPDKLQDSNYHYRFIDTFLDTTCLIYLDLTLTEDEYHKEEERISKLNGGGELKIPIIYDEENFRYPAYVASLGYNCTNEYALMIEENFRIVYVFTQFVSKSDIPFDLSLLPRGYIGYGDCRESYTIY